MNEGGACAVAEGGMLDEAMLLDRALRDCRVAVGRPDKELEDAGERLPGPGALWFGPDGNRALLRIATVVLRTEPRLRRTRSSESIQRAAKATLSGIFVERSQRKSGTDITAWMAIFRARFLDALRVEGHAVRTESFAVRLFGHERYPPFDVGPVKFMHRLDWLEGLAGRVGRDSAWMAEVERHWGHMTLGRANAAWRFEPIGDEVTRTIVEMGQGGWVAEICAKGFDPVEAERRLRLAVGFAVDVLRVSMHGRAAKGVGFPRELSVTAGADRVLWLPDGTPHVEPDLDRVEMSLHREQIAEFLAESAPGMRAGGERIAMYVQSDDSAPPRCPELSERWLYALHRYGRGCLESLDYAAVEEFAFAIDVLCGEGGSAGVKRLASAVFGRKVTDVAVSDGMTLGDLVEEVYGLRSATAHGIFPARVGKYGPKLHYGDFMGMDLPLKIERSKAEQLCARIVAQYVVALEDYSAGGGTDDPAAFLSHLELNAAAGA